MQIALTITIKNSKTFDIMVDDDQIIIDTIKILNSKKEANIPLIDYLRDIENNKRINTKFTYCQANVLNGAH
ncbi:MAG: hypothetical protein RSG07_05685, partial [Erysipelotrichaceae bacterium]